MRRLLQQFLQIESASGVILFLMALLAMIWANSPLDHWHQQFVEHVIFSTNEVLMAVFFLVVGLELKRNYLTGHFSTLSQVGLPAVAALGGMVVPALIYLFINGSDPVAVQGWATPVATDIAFALAVLTLFGNRVPNALKLFLLALAIFDDLGAIGIIALFYSHDTSFGWLCVSFVLVLIICLLNVLSVRSLIVYLLMGVLLWLTFWRCGVHPTVAGVVLAFAVPGSKVEKLESALHPWVSFLIMPLFAFVNAGFSLSGIHADVLTSNLVAGIIFGLFIGKQVGVFTFSWLLIRLRLATLPAQTSWLMLYGIAILCGIGFTMSLFLGTLSFEQESIMYLVKVRMGVFTGSILSGLVGAVVLLIAFARQREIKESQR